MRAVFATGLVLLGLYLTAMVVLRKPDGRVVFGDATHHFVQLRSLVFDRDLDFRNEYTRLYALKGDEPQLEWVRTELTATGMVRNYMPVGPALLWAPLYLLFAAIQFAMSVVGLARPPDGFERALQMAPGVTGIIAVTVAASVCWRFVRGRVDDTSAALAVFGIWMGSHAAYYSLVSPSYSHTASMLAGTLFFVHWLNSRAHLSIVRIGVYGALAGFAALMRWQDAIFLLVPLVEAVRWRAPFARRAYAGLAAIGAFFLVFSPQMAVWTVLYGQPLALPQGPSFMQWARPHPWAVLFSDYHGLFAWAPMLIPATIGLIIFMRREAGTALPLAAVLLVSWYVNSAVADWWAGEAFGARRFLSLFPLFVIGLATWLARPGAAGPLRWKVATVCVLGATNWLLLLQYQLFMKGLVDLAPYPQGWFDMWIARFVVPLDLLAWLVR